MLCLNVFVMRTDCFVLLRRTRNDDNSNVIANAVKQSVINWGSSLCLRFVMRTDCHGFVPQPRNDALIMRLTIRWGYSNRLLRPISSESPACCGQAKTTIARSLRTYCSNLLVELRMLLNSN